jgi:hypothetical protein
MFTPSLLLIPLPLPRPLSPGHSLLLFGWKKAHASHDSGSVPTFSSASASRERTSGIPPDGKGTNFLSC